ncbi:2-polyprenylphenol hydroxylase and related flavodoxin oxidoreductases [Caballeronia glathei]|jgi:TolA-binding protein|uniref:LTXXQ motif family protein n=1 Tax=Caballeronia glathei TaxID=60547 RepID=A0A069PUS2_9BURK|nr:MULTISPECIES: Spy/CpxP family protein refolding chaperone [Burkholderiaceae]KDR43589.1 hypothetical protein BG61_32295 [Caballeronia glathei]TCK43773.1 LTXXQ motif family protein [Paraburkholderia sp. BL8N3]CDY75504.1 2-polyprenylphenol hydroxylase and related flavodoxin oxidoreductases [Caballeronia glathei]
MKKTLVAFAAAFAVSAAFAQASAPVAAPASGASAPAATRHEARVEQRVAELHSNLKITPQQEDQWSKFAAVMRENAHTMGDLYRQRVSQYNTMTALQNMQQYEQITQANAEGTKRLVEAFEPLYASFTPEQKKLADTNFRESDRPTGRKGGRHHPRAAAPDAASTTKP